MIKKISNLFILLLAVKGLTQTNTAWQGYFSYNKLTDISIAPQKIYASSENALFSKNLSTNYLTTTTSVDGLKAENITAIHYSDNYSKLLIGNQNGLLLIINSDGKIDYKNGIVAEVPVSPFFKKINHFFEFNGKVYLSCDYGISVFDLTTMEFGDTYYIGNNGQQVKVYQTTILNGEIFAVTDSAGIKKATLSNSNLVDFNQWQLFDNGFWTGITSLQNKLIGMNSNGRLYKHNGVSFDEFFIMNQSGLDLRTSSGLLIATNPNAVYIFNTNLQPIATLLNSQFTQFAVSFNCASISNDQIFIATNEVGLLSSSLLEPTNFQVVKPNGPDRNNIFRLKKTATTLWATYGGYSITYDPTLLQEGISKYSKESGWGKIPFSELFGATSLTDIVSNPNNENELYVCSFHNGLLKIKNDVITFYNQNSSPPNGPENQQIITPSYISVRINGPEFDSKGNLWLTNSLVNRALKTLKTDGTWQSVNDWPNQLASVVEERYSKIAIDKNDTKWVPTYRGNGLIAYNENYANKYIKVQTGTDGNLPSNDVRTVVIDKRNQVWIGTARGLRYIRSVDTFVSETEIETESIIILEDGLAQELFYEQSIMEIVVDGANRKWVSLADAGVYLVSADGQETIYKFTKENSPLPSNTVNDIEIDSATGEVFFATDKGLVSFKDTATKPSDDLSNVYAYPNPVRPGFAGTVKISGLTNNAIVKITDIEGNLVFETTSEGGTIEWDTTAFGKHKVASGVYMILVAAEDGIETTVKKVMIIR